MTGLESQDYDGHGLLIGDDAGFLHHQAVFVFDEQ
jgi:hypothetical protein